ncbi:hypothetical protein K1719_002574 [Acacia pycnantha]|nr:hypothetical protein K1719_002574 [Acacia pycnantha]
MADAEEFCCFVGGLSWSTSDRKLKDSFEKFGKLLEARSLLLHLIAKGHALPKKSAHERENASEKSPRCSNFQGTRKLSSSLRLLRLGELKAPCEATQNQGSCSNNSCFFCNNNKQGNNQTVRRTFFEPCWIAMN